MFVKSTYIQDPAVVRTFDAVDRILDGALYYYTGSARVKTGQGDLHVFRIPYFVDPATDERRNAWIRGELQLTHGIYSSLAGDGTVDIKLYGTNHGDALTLLSTNSVTVLASAGILQEFFERLVLDLTGYDFLVLHYDPTSGGFPEVMAGVGALWRPAAA